MYLTDKELDKVKKVTHGFFTRKGGVSKGIFASLNCGFKAGDPEENVQKNRQVAMKKLGLKPNSLCTLKQIHSNIVVTIKDPYGHEQSPEADGIVTDQPNTSIGILTADCAPVLLADASGKVVGACHAGWRGAKAGIVEKTVATMQKMGCALPQIVASIGPCIGPDSYEVGPEFYDVFVKETVNNAQFFKKSRKSSGHYLFDLASYIEYKLKVIGIGKISKMGNDTFKEGDKFFSYRKNTHNDEKQYGCQLSVISINP